MATKKPEWTPPKGRHPVNIGGSLGRALKARKGVPTKAAKTPVNDFFQFKYGFKPDSMDVTKPGILEVTQGDNGGISLRMERQSERPEEKEAHVFNGKVEPSRELECVLIYNEVDGVFTLEKLDSTITLQYDRNAVAKGRPSRPQSSSPLPTPSPAPSRAEPNDNLPEELNRELLSAVDDAEGDIDAEFEEILPKQLSANTKGKRRQEDEEFTLPQARTKPKAKAPPKHAVKPAVGEGAAPKASAAKGKGKAKAPAAIVGDVEEEDLEFGKPAKPAKRARASPVDLALPRASNAAHLPPAPPPPPSSAALSLNVNDSDDEEWDEVAGIAAPASAVVEGPIFVDAGEEEEVGEEVGEEIDLDLFGAEMERELEVEGEGEGEGEEGEEGDGYAEQPTAGRPISLNQFAGGGDPSVDDDDYSSSEDSDDD